MNVLTKTSLVRLTKLEEELSLKNHIYAKIGAENPTGSIKDVTTFNMLEDYKNRGILIPNSVIIEATSGNTGISLSYFTKMFDYKAIIVMPTSMSKERREMIKKYGAELVLVEGGMKECNQKAQELLKVYKNSFIFSQFDNPANYEAHYKYTGKEIYEDLPSVSYIFAGIGTGGTISGTGKFFKEHKLDTKMIGIEPLESPLITKGKAGTHKIQGIGANFIPNNFHKEYVDEVITVSGDSAIEFAKKVRVLEDLDIGISSGAALLGAINYLNENNIISEDIVVICPDKGDRYSW